MDNAVTIVEVGPRDGLQNEQRLIALADKVRLIDLLSDCGLSRIEAGAFVHPGKNPQMADSGEVFARIQRKVEISYSALVPNLPGYQQALSAEIDAVAVFASASETFSRKNINCTITESLARFQPVIAAARQDSIPVRGYVSCVAGCPYEGTICPDQVAKIASALYEMGCEEISLGDTIGCALPDTVDKMLDAVLEVVPAFALGGHFHDTKGQALENVALCLVRGLRIFDGAIAGLGGCPFAPGAPGNVDSLALAELFEKAGFHTGIDRNKLALAAQFAQTIRQVS